ncbi:ATPase [Oceaniferula spumae]|uniref:ATPase n=1 Tax=Oceaniferula spumae TaxID=2979115 RepID=A0AAT9FNG0_9BACT
MIHSLQIEGYRSLLDISLKLAPLTVVQGANGVGKSNLYKALKLFAALADGTFPQSMAEEGGTPSCFWAGPVPGPKRPKTVKLFLGSASFDWNVVFGLVPTTPGDPTMFRTDPDMKKESMHSKLGSHSRAEWSGDISHNESILSHIRDAVSYPALALAREDILSWRFYDGFRNDVESPLRQGSPRAWSPVLATDGANLAATLQTIRESSFPYRLDEVINMAFPNHSLGIVGGDSKLHIEWSLPELNRPLKASELSDGTLRFLALCAALLGPKAPACLVLNEPENSLNPSLFPALAQLIRYANEASQVIVITHSEELAELLVDEQDATLHSLVLDNGATRLREDLGTRKVWRFD